MSSQSASIRPFALAWLAYTFLILLLAVSVWIPSGLYKDFDFRALYAGGVLARTDPSHLYDLSRQKQVEDSLVERRDPSLPFAPLAYEALFYIPFSFLSYRNAYVLAVFSNAVLIALCFLAARREFSKTVPLWQPRPGFIFFSFMPTAIVLAQGQDAMLLLLVLCLTWTLLEHSQDFGAGFVLANMLLKPHLALPVALFLAIRYGWRFVAGFVTGAAAVIAICLPFWLHGGFRAWWRMISGLSLVSGNNKAQEAAVGVYSWAMPNLRGALLFLLGHELSPHVLFVIVCLASMALMGWGLVIAPKLSRQNAFAFSIIVTALVSYNLEPHDLALLLLPMVLMETGGSKALAICRDVILGLPIALLIFASQTPPGAGFTLLSAPLLVGAFLLSRGAAAQSEAQKALP